MSDDSRLVQMQREIQRLAALVDALKTREKPEYLPYTAFTPAYAGQSTPGVTTYTTRTGGYGRDGDTAFFSLYLNWTAATGTGNALVTGLPIATRNTSNFFYAISVWYSGVTYAAGAGISAIIRPNQTQIELWNEPASNVSAAQIAVEAAGEVILTGWYFI